MTLIQDGHVLVQRSRSPHTLTGNGLFALIESLPIYYFDNESEE